jgi:subtilisin family serine protease
VFCNTKKGSPPDQPHSSLPLQGGRGRVGIRSSIIFGLLLILCPIAVYAGAGRAAQYAPGEILVKFKDGIPKEYTERIHKSLGFKAVQGLKRIPVERINLPDGVSVEEAVTLYRADRDVEYAEPNYIRRALLTPNDTYFTLLWGLQNTGQTGCAQDADIDAPEAWSIQNDCTGIVIAVLDTGADLDHDDLMESIWRNTGEDWSNGSPGNNGEDDDGNGKTDDYYGWDFTAGESGDNDPNDDNIPYYHGTHVAGTIGARGNNGLGITGVCWGASIMILKILDEDGIGYLSGEIEAIAYALEKGTKIISLSFGGAGYSEIEYAALESARDAGVLVIAAAGNGGDDQIGDNNDETGTAEYPASYDLDNIISVTATDCKDEMPSWANYGLKSVDVAAPAVDILGAKAGNSYQYLSGSSMAVPHVAGLAALIWACHGEFAYDQVRAIIFNGVNPNLFLEGKIRTGGRINAYNSLIYFSDGDNDHPCFITARAY